MAIKTSSDLANAYSGQEGLRSARELRERARQRRLELIDSRMRFEQAQFDKAEELKREMETEARNPTNMVLSSAAMGSKFGPVGAAVGAAIGSVLGAGQDYKHFSKRMKEEGKGKGWRRKKMFNNWFNPIKGLERIGSAFQKNPKAVASNVATLAMMGKGKGRGSEGVSPTASKAMNLGNFGRQLSAGDMTAADFATDMSNYRSMQQEIADMQGAAEMARLPEGALSPGKLELDQNLSLLNALDKSLLDK